MCIFAHTSGSYSCTQLHADALHCAAAKDMDKATLYVSVDGNEAFKKNFAFLRPPEMQRIELDFSSFGIKEGSKVEVRVEER